MNYIGSKYSLIDFLETSIDKTLKLYNESRKPSEMVFADLFAGTGVVSGSFKKQGYSIIANDIQYYSYVITKHMIENNGNLDKSRCKQLIEELDPAYKRKTRLNLKGSNEFHLAGMNCAMSNCTPLMKRQNTYWVCLSVEKNDIINSIKKK